MYSKNNKLTLNISLLCGAPTKMTLLPYSALQTLCSEIIRRKSLRMVMADILVRHTMRKKVNRLCVAERNTRSHTNLVLSAATKHVKATLDCTKST
jgi:hypothetical protein